MSHTTYLSEYEWCVTNDSSNEVIALFIHKSDALNFKANVTRFYPDAEFRITQTYVDISQPVVRISA